MVLKRSHTCGELTLSDVGKTVTLNGWVARGRDLGGLVFVDLRDRYGVTQIVADESLSAQAVHIHAVAAGLRAEDVIGVTGVVRERESKNPEMFTGDIEVVAGRLEVYSKAEVPPFEIKEELNVSEDLRFRYRYLDLRRPALQYNLLLRSKVTTAIRNYYQEHQFAEIETPVLMKSTPEGARDYLVPSRVNPGMFYALPQSPQTYKQILMVSGFDRYVQIVKCFRDEDLRADRQPEFTQVDVEMSFVDEEVIYELHEGLMARLWKEFLKVELSVPFPRMTYDEAMHSYGSDKPDIRFEMPIKDLSDAVKGCGFRVFEETIANGGKVLGITVKGEALLGRGALDRFAEKVKEQAAVPGVITMKVSSDGIQSSVGKFLSDEVHQAMAAAAGADSGDTGTPGDLVLILAGDAPAIYQKMGTMRLLAGEEFGLIPASSENAQDPNAWKFLWVTDFPLVEWDDEEKRYVALHHPFTSPHVEDQELFEESPQSMRARAYDLVLNGSEIGGGSIRIHSQEMQKRMFRLLGIDDEEAEAKFGFLLQAFTYGAPPHGGIALGLDRILMIMTGAASIRDVIAFPKNQRAQSLMDGSPSQVDARQLEELHIALSLPKKS